MLTQLEVELSHGICRLRLGVGGGPSSFTSKFKLKFNFNLKIKFKLNFKLFNLNLKLSVQVNHHDAHCNRDFILKFKFKLYTYRRAISWCSLRVTDRLALQAARGHVTSS